MRAMLATVLSVLALGCCQPLKGVAVLVEPQLGRPEAPETVWQRYRAYLASVERGETVIAFQFDRSIEYFTELTDIDSGLSGSYAGYVLDRRVLAVALEQWDKWYVEHQGTIQWDDGAGRYVSESHSHPDVPKR